MGSDTMESYRKTAKPRSKGFTLVASLMMLLLLSGIAIGLMMMVTTESKVGGTDLQNNIAFHAADGGIEKMASDLSATFQNAQSPSTSQICGLSATSYQPSMVGVTWTQYSVQPASGCTINPPTHNWGQITGGPNQGLWAQIIPINMLTTAALPGGQEVSMTRGAQVALIPVFQYGVFCEGDCGFFDSPNLTFAGRVHTNSDLYLGVAGGATLTFNDKLEAYGNVVTQVLPNGLSASSFNDTGNVYIPTTVGGCSTPTTNCVLKATNGGTQYGDGSVTGAGSSTPQTGSSYNGTYWNPFSKSGSPTGSNYMLVNGNYGSTVNVGTGARKLSMPFVSGTTLPYQIIRRSMSTDGTALSQSREYNLASIHVLLSDDPADLPGGASDANNVRLANVPANAAGVGASNPYGIAATTGITTGTGTLPAPPSGYTYNTYFATATNAIPTGTCNGSYTSTSNPKDAINCLPDWPYPPAPWTPTYMTNVAAGTDPSGCVLLCPSSQTNAWSATNTTGVIGAPFISSFISTALGGMTGGPTLYTSGNVGTYAGSSVNTFPTFLPCPPTYALAANTPGNCPLTTSGAPTSPFYLVSGGSTFTSPVTTAQSSAVATATWNLIDGWLRVEYKDAAGVWHPVTNEWLGLGFARDVVPPTAAGANPIHPNAILLLQEPADRFTQLSAAYPTSAITSTSHPAGFTTVATAACNATTGTGPSKTCTSWSVAPPQVLVDSTSSSWLYGETSSTSPSSPAASTVALQSPTRFNWYPINFYDAREGEPRDTVWSNTYASDNSCTSNGIMNAVEIDVGNLNAWLVGTTGTSGTSVDAVAQNGYVLYFSDRRGMLPNPIVYGTSFVKSGDSGLEDVINANGTGDGANGTPDGVLEPAPPGKQLSPEDVAELGLGGTALLENFGAQNLGLGFYGTVANPVTEPVSTTCTNVTMPCVLAASNNANPGPNMWYQITTNDTNLTKPDPYNSASYNNRIGSCSTARKNWVSGARHVLKLVDGALGNVPNSPTGTVADPGGFTVASENPVYVQGNYNTNSTDAFWTGGGDAAGHSAAAVIADTVTVLSNSWVDQYSTMGNPANSGNGGNYSPTVAAGNRTATTTYYRLAVAGGKNLAFPFPSWENNTDYGFGTDGGIHNFLHFLEDWGGSTLNYGGSLVSLYYSTYATGVFKCCEYSVYQPPTRNYIFDNDFTSPSGLPPGTPMFRDVETLSYRQLFTTRLSGQ